MRNCFFSIPLNNILLDFNTPQLSKILKDGYFQAMWPML
jgi:hypothetical protein